MDFDVMVGMFEVGGGIVAAVVVANYALGPIYGVWRQRLQGQADFARAEAETRIAVLRADAELKASHHYAEADIVRAKGIAASIKEVEETLGVPEGYLRWKYIHMLEESDVDNQIIYVPTEAGLPILEAGKRKS